MPVVQPRPVVVARHVVSLRHGRRWQCWTSASQVSGRRMIFCAVRRASATGCGSWSHCAVGGMFCCASCAGFSLTICPRPTRWQGWA